MKIAIPTADGKLCMHFGHCQLFALLEVDPDSKEIIKKDMLTPPPHEPGVIPKWLSEQGANCIISGGMGTKAKSFFEAMNVKVVTGAQPAEPETVALDFLNERLSLGPNTCDH